MTVARSLIRRGGDVGRTFRGFRHTESRVGNEICPLGHPLAIGGYCRLDPGDIWSGIWWPVPVLFHLLPCLLQQKNPQLRAFESLQRVFNKEDKISLELQSDNGDVFQADVLAAIRDLTEKSLPGSLSIMRTARPCYPWRRGAESGTPGRWRQLSVSFSMPTGRTGSRRWSVTISSVRP